MNQLPNNAEARLRLEDEVKKLRSIDPDVPSAKLPDTELKEIDYAAPDDAALKKQAEDALEEYKLSGVQSVKTASEENEKQLKQKRDAFEAGLKDSLDALGKSYEEAARNIDSDVLKRGLARSSVATSAKSDLEREYLDKAGSLRESYGKEISALDGEISAVGAKLNAALNDFNIAYAAKLNAKLNELKSEREKKTAEVIKFNNDVREKAAKLAAEKASTESKLRSEAIAQRKAEGDLGILTSEQEEKVNKAVYEKMDNFLASLSPEQAKLEINNYTMYRKYLSLFYYSMLYEKYGR